MLLSSRERQIIDLSYWDVLGWQQWEISGSTTWPRGWENECGAVKIFGLNTPLLAQLISSMLLIILKPLRLITGHVYQDTSPRFNITLITDDEPVSTPASSRMHFCPEDEKQEGWRYNICNWMQLKTELSLNEQIKMITLYSVYKDSFGSALKQNSSSLWMLQSWRGGIITFARPRTKIETVNVFLYPESS